MDSSIESPLYNRNIRIHESILFHGREEIRTSTNLRFVVSDESPMYNIVQSIKKEYLLTDARRFELQQPLVAESVESPINIHVLKLYVFIKRGTDARRFELYFIY